MAKESMKAREVKRAKMVARYAEKRAKYLAEGNYEALQSIPKNASPVRLHNRCKITGRPKGYMRQFGVSRINLGDGIARIDPRVKSKLVIYDTNKYCPGSRDQFKINFMTDPIADYLTRYGMP